MSEPLMETCRTVDGRPNWCVIHGAVENCPQREAGDLGRLLPGESLAVAVGRAQVRRGDSITPNIGAVLLATIERLTKESPTDIEQHSLG